MKDILPSINMPKPWRARLVTPCSIYSASDVLHLQNETCISDIPLFLLIVDMGGTGMRFKRPCSYQLSMQIGSLVF